MFCCSKNILDSADQRRRKSYAAYNPREQKDDGNELITIHNKKISTVNILKKGSELTSKLKGEENNTVKKYPVGKSNVLKYYEKNILKDKNSKSVICTDFKKEGNNNNYDSYRLNKDKNERDSCKGIGAPCDFSKLNTRNKIKVLNEIQSQINDCLKEEDFSIHDDIIFLNIFRLTHKKIYSLLDRGKKKPGCYNCNDILEMVLNGSLHKNSLIKRKSDSKYVQLKEKMNEIHFLKNLELQYYLKIKKYKPSVKSKFEETYTKENIMFLELSESLLAEKVKSLKKFLVSPFDKNIVEILLIPKQKRCNKFYGYKKVISNLFITKYISVYFYHIIEKKIEKYNIMRKTGPIHITIKLKTNYPQAIQTIFRYIYDKSFNLNDLDFKLLVTVYIECIHLKIISIIDDVINAINEKAYFDNIVKVLDLSSIFKETPLFKDFARIISDSGVYIFARNYHYLLDAEIYSHLLSFDNIMINEMKIFIESIKFIIKNNCDMREQCLIFRSIRFNLLNNEQLYNIQNYIKNCFEDIIHNKYDATNFICIRYQHSNIEHIDLNDDGKKSSKELETRNTGSEGVQEEKEKGKEEKGEEKKEGEKKDKEKKNGITIIEERPNIPFSEEIKNLNEFYKIINKEAFEPPYISTSKKEISLKRLTKCINNIYNILFDNVFKKMLNKEQKKERCKAWNENKDFKCVYDFKNGNYSFQLIKKKQKVERYSFTYGDERLVNECKLFFQITKTKGSNICIGIVLKTKELNVWNNSNINNNNNNKSNSSNGSSNSNNNNNRNINNINANSKALNVLMEHSENLVIYFDFFVNDFYACNIDKDNSTFVNKTKLNLYAHENKITNEDIVNYNILVINQTLNIDIVILPKNSFSFSFAFLRPTIFLGDVIKKPFIHIKPFFILKDSLDSISIPSIIF
ncbi:conserved Plasmodium protein, unknown function [Plasmodium malariae]|uniref:Uncharacterized protein n=1 Tax=Plasmodium malariae TaxID=5858 RepID=A0A1D3SPD6_PLAMA|nr:conserved Plasmodium protein, unknown function [Plasmodium malariae]SCO93773.1 conserved Plasmodium protein, unknown function [Plasmodium malariae]